MSSASATVRVEKATSHLLIGPDWTMNMDICDMVNSNHWQAKDVVKAVKKRLQNKDPKVQFLALTLLETMVKNCGNNVHFQVVERDILQEMTKIVKKKTDMQVRNKVLFLLDSWQEAFGGPGGKFPQFYWAYVELKRSGVVFPPRAADTPPIFTPPVAHPAQSRQPQSLYVTSSNASGTLNEAMQSEMGNLSLSDLGNIWNIADLLNDMLQAVNPYNREAVKDELIVDLVSQSRSNQRKIMQLVSSTMDEELLGQGLALNDRLQSVVAKHDAIASGSPLPTEASAHKVMQLTPKEPNPAANKQSEGEEDEDDDFVQLARRNLHVKPMAGTSISKSGEQEGSSNQSDLTTASSSNSEASSSVTSNALVPVDPPTPVKTLSKEQEMIDLLSITLSTNPTSPQTPVALPTAQHQNGSPLPPSSSAQGYSLDSQSYPSNTGYASYNSYVAPWAQPAQPPAQPAPWAQPALPPAQPAPWAQPALPPAQPQLYQSSYPYPLWGVPGNATLGSFPSTAYQLPASPAMPSASPSAYGPISASQPIQRYNSFGSRVNNVPTTIPESQVHGNQRQKESMAAPALPSSQPILRYNSFGSRVNNVPTALPESQVNSSLRQKESMTAAKPYYMPDKLFDDLIDIKSFTSGNKMRNGSTSHPGTSGQPMIRGQK